MPDRLPVDGAQFWRERLDYALAENEPHKAVWNTDRHRWEAVNEVHRDLLAKMLRPVPGGAPVKVLDCGCGIGTLAGLLPPGVEYHGVDLSRDLLALAREMNPALAAKGRFRRGDLRELPYSDGEFTVAVCRGTEGMVTANLGQSAWRTMEAEMLRVAGKLIVLSYERPDVARVADAPPQLDPGAIRTIVHTGGELKYRLGWDSSVEIYDLIVEEKWRRAGVGRKLVERLFRDDRHSVYAFTRATNTVARAFYAAVGFREAPLPEFYRGGDAVFLYRINPNGIAHCDPLT